MNKDIVQTPIRNIEELRASLQKARHFRKIFNRPFITITYAQGIDGSIASKNREKTVISCPESAYLTHSLRTLHDTILVGIGTVLADNPRLTARLVRGPNPTPIVLDTHQRIPDDSHLLNATNPQTVVVCSNQKSRKASSRLVLSRAKLLPCDLDADGLINLHALMDLINDLEINSIMVEGGARVISSFLAAGLADLFVITIAPKFMGGLSVFGHKNCQEIRIKDISYQSLGQDIIVWGRPSWSRQ